MEDMMRLISMAAWVLDGGFYGNGRAGRSFYLVNDREQQILSMNIINNATSMTHA